MSDRMHVLLRVLSGVAAAAGATLLGMALLTVVVMCTGMSDAAITACNQAIKLASLFAGVWVTVRPGGRKGLLLGSAVGLIYMAVGYGLYCLLDEAMITFAYLAVEFAMGAVLGGLMGAFLANLPTRRRRRNA